MEQIPSISRFAALSIAVFFSAAASAGGLDRDMAADDRMLLDSIPGWIRRNVTFPEDAYQYGTVGVEKFVVSADWTGRVFISSPLNTLNPAVAEEIKSVVSRAPRCRFAGVFPEDIYKLVELDFGQYVPAARKDEVTAVGEYRPAAFDFKSSPLPSDDSRELFTDWLSMKLRMPKEIPAAFADTLTLNYTIDREGRVCSVAVGDCGIGKLGQALASLARRSPGWSPAVTRYGTQLETHVSCRILVRTDANGGKLPFVLCRDKVCRNSSEPSPDTSLIILNPEEKAFVDGGPATVAGVIHECLSRAGENRKVKYSGLCVVETDGSVGMVEIDASDTAFCSVLTDIVKGCRWTPATQGGRHVRTICSFSGGYSLRRSASRAPARQNAFMYQQGRRPAYYDSDYEKSQRSRWKRLCRAYPSLRSDIYGYSRFRSLDRLSYMEALMMHGASGAGVTPGSVGHFWVF